jgi:hypothetical protein
MTLAREAVRNDKGFVSIEGTADGRGDVKQKGLVFWVATRVFSV